MTRAGRGRSWRTRTKRTGARSDRGRSRPPGCLRERRAGRALAEPPDPPPGPAGRRHQPMSRGSRRTTAAAGRVVGPGGARSAATTWRRRHGGRAFSAALQALAKSGAITEPALYPADYDAYVAAKRSLARRRGTRNAELGCAGERAGDRGRPRADGLAAWAPLLRRSKRTGRWWTTEPLLSNGARVAFPPASSCGSTTRARASRSNGLPRSARPTATTWRATRTQPRQVLNEAHRASDPACGRHRLGVHVPLRWRRAAVDERPLAGDGSAGYAHAWSRFK